MAKNEKYTFTSDQIEFVKNVKKNNKINTVQGDKVQRIFRSQVDVKFNMCTGCKGSVARNFNLLVGLIEKSIGTKIESYGEKKAVKKPVAKKPEPKKETKKPVKKTIKKTVKKK